MKKLDVTWSVSQKQYDILTKQFEEFQKKHISHSLENWDYTLLHASNLTKKQKKNRAKNKSAKQSRKINRK